MIVQGLAYSIAIKKNWENFFPCWSQVVENASEPAPINWLVIGLAPSTYWARFDPNSTDLNSSNWKAINSFVNRAASAGFELRFAAFDILNSGEVLPILGNFRWLDQVD